jgi:hypothetical protein
LPITESRSFERLKRLISLAFQLLYWTAADENGSSIGAFYLRFAFQLRHLNHGPVSPLSVRNLRPGPMLRSPQCADKPTLVVAFFDAKPIPLVRMLDIGT